MKAIRVTKIEFKRINNDVNGNPRHVCHFLHFLGEDEGCNYDLALRRSRQLGGKKFHNKQYGGGIVFQMYDGEQEEMTNRIYNIANGNNGGDLTNIEVIN